MRFAVFSIALLSTLAVAASAEEPTFEMKDMSKDKSKDPATEMKWETKEQSEASAALKKAMAEAKGPFTVGGTVADFTLTDTEGKTHVLSDYLAQGKTVILEWFNPDCPFVKKHHALTQSMAETQDLAAEKGVVWLAVNSGAPGKQGNGIERNKTAREEYKMDYPVLLDESGVVGKMYGAKTTPDMFLISPQGKLLYQGAIDNDSTPQKLGETNYVRQALELYLAGKPITVPETKPYGCSVKYAT